MRQFYLDNPLTRSMLFYPRRAQADTSYLEAVYDGSFTLPDLIKISYRLYHQSGAKAVILCFHGNAEAAADYDPVAALFRPLGYALLVVDYRGYGWSSGSPSASALLPDAEKILALLPGLLHTHGLADCPLVVLGRSLGSASAIHLAYRYPQYLSGLIVESGFAHEPLILAALGIPRFFLRRMPGLFDNLRKMRSIRIPALIIHGQRDEVIPFEHGQMLFSAIQYGKKTKLYLPGIGHNDLLLSSYVETYVSAIDDFIGNARSGKKEPLSFSKGE